VISSISLHKLDSAQVERKILRQTEVPDEQKALRDDQRACRERNVSGCDSVDVAERFEGPDDVRVHATTRKAQDQCVAENLELTAHFGTSSAKVCE